MEDIFSFISVVVPRSYLLLPKRSSSRMLKAVPIQLLLGEESVTSILLSCQSVVKVAAVFFMRERKQRSVV